MEVTKKLIGGYLSVNRYSRNRCKDCTKCNNQDIAWFDTCYTLNTYNANYAIRLFSPRPTRLITNRSIHGYMGANSRGINNESK